MAADFCWLYRVFIGGGGGTESQRARRTENSQQICAGSDESEIILQDQDL